MKTYEQVTKEDVLRFINTSTCGRLETAALNVGDDIIDARNRIKDLYDLKKAWEYLGDDTTPLENRIKEEQSLVEWMRAIKHALKEEIRKRHIWDNRNGFDPYEPGKARWQTEY